MPLPPCLDKCNTFSFLIKCTRKIWGSESRGPDNLGVQITCTLHHHHFKNNSQLPFTTWPINQPYGALYMEFQHTYRTSAVSTHIVSMHAQNDFHGVWHRLVHSLGCELVGIVSRGGRKGGLLDWVGVFQRFLSCLLQGSYPTAHLILVDGLEQVLCGGCDHLQKKTGSVIIYSNLKDRGIDIVHAIVHLHVLIGCGHCTWDP